MADRDCFGPHQANMRITDAMARSMKLPESVRIARDIVDQGNTSAASIPLALDRMIGPEAFRVVHAADGAPLKDRMKVEDGKVCLPSEEGAHRCLLTFGKSEKRWRLVGMQAMGLTIEVAQADGQAGD